MSVFNQGGITYNQTSSGGRHGWRGSLPNAWEYGLSNRGRSVPIGRPGGGNNFGETPVWDEDDVRNNLKMEEREALAERLRDYGGNMFELFDKFKPQFEYLAENAGVSGADLNQRLADSSADYSANVDAMQKANTRQQQRMGVNPNSGAAQAMQTSNALQKAAGLSMNQNQVRNIARQQDMGERFQAAGLGLQIGGHGVNATHGAADSYAQMGGQMQSAKQFYDNMKESSRRYNTDNAFRNKQFGLQRDNQMFNQAMQRHMHGRTTSYQLDNWGKVINQEHGFGF